MKINSMAVWLDHKTARIFYAENETLQNITIHSTYKQQTRISGEGTNKTQFGNLFAGNRESNLNNKFHSEIVDFYKKLAHELEPASDILIMGPAGAGEQLMHHLQKNHLFKNTPIAYHKTDYITKNQMTAKAKVYFNTVLNITEKEIVHH